ncbi:MAG: hypothetical protein ACXV7G_12325, partial [Halobacteriota archaeon]
YLRPAESLGDKQDLCHVILRLVPTGRLSDRSKWLPPYGRNALRVIVGYETDAPAHRRWTHRIRWDYGLQT